MGLHLDWEIEAEGSTVRGDKEDPSSAKARRLARFRILLGILIIVGILGGIYGVFVWRLRTVDAEIQRALEDTVQAEITTLRLADRSAFLSIQRSADPNWINQQSAIFDQYQQFKSDGGIQLTGEIQSISVDGSRGRVQVQEIIEGVPYLQTWFYWRFADADGWRHGPPDYEFWGSSETIEAEYLTVRYRTLDEAVARATADSVNSWLTSTCGFLPCEELPPLTIEILPEPSITAQWNVNNPWTLQFPSPYVDRARADRPFSDDSRARVATLIADRLLTHATGSIEPVFPADAVYIQEALKGWLVERFSGISTESHLIRSYASRYGDTAAGGVVQQLSPGSDIRVLLAPAEVNALDELAVDWRDYLTWRLELEDELHRNRNEAIFVSLYDTRLDDVAGIAFQRFGTAYAYEDKTVTAVQHETQPDGTPILSATVVIGTGETAREQNILFRLSDGLWKRAN